MDMKTNSGIYTWNNKQKGDRKIASRLDRFVISKYFLLDGPDLDASILPRAASNHWLVMLHWNNPRIPTRKPLCFEKFWLEHLGFKEQVNSWWK